MRKVIAVLLILCLCVAMCACAVQESVEQQPVEQQPVEQQKIKIPDIEKLDVTTAKTLLAGKGLIPKVEYEYNNDYDYDLVIRTEPAIGSEVEEDTPVTLYVCKGPQYYELPHTLGAIYDIEGIEPFIPWNEDPDGVGTKAHRKVWVEEGYLYISLYLGCTSEYALEFYGDFGEASINDTFDKTVPIDVIYESKKIDNTGKLTYFDFKIPLSDLGVQKPTNLNIRYYLNVDGKRTTARAKFDLTW